jgi:FkbM family methyltransferase
MKEFVKKFIPVKFHKVLYRIFLKPFKPAHRTSYAQCGEDMILETIFLNRKNGFYVDIGANNPIIQSNTHYFYKKGWKGINIDANPKSMKYFNKVRKRDANLNIPISDKEELLDYYIFSSSFFNTFSKEQMEVYKDMLVDTQQLQTQTLENLLNKHLINKEIDFLSIDTEGWDLKVLKSNNWNKYRPKVILIEFLIYENNDGVEKSEIAKFLTNLGYKYFCSTPCNSFYIDEVFFNLRFKVRNCF